VLTKWGQIREYEVGITAMARAAGLSVGAYISIDDIREEVIRQPGLHRWGPTLQAGLGDINPTHDLWDLIIRRHLLRLKAKHLQPPTNAQLRYPSESGSKTS
jgi:hypothetical protein